MVDPRSISLAQLVMVERTSVSLKNTVTQFAFWVTQLPAHVATLRGFYSMLDVENEIKDGDSSYPREEYDKSGGMSVEFR